MNTSRLSALGSLPANLWHRFNIWRAMRMYARIVQTAIDMEDLKETADRLMRLHAQDPQASLPLQMPTKAIDQRAREADGR